MLDYDELEDQIITPILPHKPLLREMKERACYRRRQRQFKEYLAKVREKNDCPMFEQKQILEEK